MHFEEKTLTSNSIYKGNITEYEVQEVKLPNGNKATREIVRHDEAAAIIPFINNKLVCVKQYRKPIEKVTVEIPAGLVDEGESTIQTAERELEEETAYKAGNLSLVTSFYTTPGFTDEKVYIYEANDLEMVEEPLEKDEDETIEILELTYDQAWEAYEKGFINDSKTVFALYYWKIKQLENFK